MNEHADPNELPELSNEGVQLLYSICQRASQSNKRPFAALFAAHDTERAETQIEPELDGVLFRYIMRVGDSTKEANKAGKPVDLVQQLREVLGALGITWVNDGESEPDHVTEPIEELNATSRKPYKGPRRRVSFDDARLEETWLSEHSQPINTSSRAAPHSLLRLPPRRASNFTSQRRARSTSSQRSLPIRDPALKYSQQVASSAGDVSEPDDQANPTLLFEVSQVEMEQQAEAFFSTSGIRTARHAFNAWRDVALRLQSSQSEAYTRAVAHDRRTLIRQALDQWRSTLAIRREEHHKEGLLKKLDDKAQRARDLFLVTKSFTHWATSCRDEQLKITVAQHRCLRIKYFKRWQTIATKNQVNVRRILVRKYVRIWREKLARRLHWEEQAVALYEETLVRRCKTAWFWHFCSQRVEGWHEQWIERRALSRLIGALEAQQQRIHRAESHYSTHLVKRSLGTLADGLQGYQSDELAAQQHRHQTLEISTLSTIHKQTKLAPIARTVRQKCNANVQRKAFRIWRSELTLSRQAVEVDHKRLLQTAWTNWNDSLRCRALVQKIDERVIVEHLYRWVLRERLGLFQRNVNGRLLGRFLVWWRSKVEAERDRLGDAEIVFLERQRRRRLAFTMLRLNSAMRIREDAERTVVEFANSRTLPKVLDVWKEKAEHAMRLASGAAYARSYLLGVRILRIWKDKMTQHKEKRKRDAYVQIRARVKIELVNRCFVKWRTACMEVHSMNGEAERRAQWRLAESGTRCLEAWRAHGAQYAELNLHAVELDQSKLLSSALAAMLAKQAQLASMNQEALEKWQETDQALLAGALRRMQWATFTTATRKQSASALWANHRDKHIKQMLRHWTAQASARRAAANETGDVTKVPEEEPESPSLRPASRAASRTSTTTTELVLPSSPPLLSATPGYMRTPTRPRRAGRFRPLPTPVPFTPMAFDSGLLVTTPAPLPTAQPRHVEQQLVEGLTPQVTPFSRKLRAGGIAATGPSALTAGPSSVLKRSAFGRSIQGGTGKSVRFAGGSRFGRRDDSHDKHS